MVVLETNHGEIRINLFADKAPETVANFLNYVNSEFYNGTIFHRVIDGFMVQGGGFASGMEQKPVEAPIKNEANNGVANKVGTLAMARTPDPHSATAQFFINVNDNDFLNFSSETSQGWGYCVFGEVVEVLKAFDRETVRYFLINGHYRSQLNYSQENLEQARSSLERIYTALRGVELVEVELKGNAYVERFETAMNDDFNTPEALPVIFELSKEVNRLKESDAKAAGEHAFILVKLAEVLGIAQQDPESFLQGEQDDDEVAQIEALIEKRRSARENKDWAAADEARDALTALGVVLEDSAGKTTWRKA